MTNWEHMKGGQSGNIPVLLFTSSWMQMFLIQCMGPVSPRLFYHFKGLISDYQQFTDFLLFPFHSLRLLFNTYGWIQGKGKVLLKSALKIRQPHSWSQLLFLGQMHIPKLLSQPPTFCASHYFLRQKRRTCC